MANLQFTRVKEVFSTREEAINKLDGLCRTYAEGVVVKYLSPCVDECGNRIERMIFAIYRSSEKGDYEIVYDTDPSNMNSGGLRVFKARKQKEDQTDLECINVALFGETPKNGDIVTITSYDGSSIVSYIYYEDDWVCIGLGDGSSGGGSSIVDIKVEDTNTVDLTLESNNTLKADIKLDNQSILYDSTIDGIRVNKIYGGTF